VTLRRVTEVSGISAGAITHFLGSKDAMVAAAVTRAYRDYEARMEAILDSDMDPPDRLASWISDIISPATGGEWSLWVGLWGRAPFDARIRYELGNVYKAHSRHLARLIDDGIASGHFREGDAGVAADQLIAMVDGLAMRVLLDTAACSFEYARTVVDTFLGTSVLRDSRPSPSSSPQL
jgi:AcrR family transcriptional regulator